MPICGAISTMYGLFESRRDFLDELKDVPALPSPFDLAVAQLVGIDAADGSAVGILDLREIRAPLDRVALRAHDRLLARKLAAFLLGLVHELWNQLPGAARLSPGSTPLMRNIVEG